MSLESRWFRLNVGWWETDWISVLSAEAQLAWIKFLGRVKTHGYGGTLGKVSTALLARQWMQGEESILQMLKAAKIEGAIVDDGESWTVPKWKLYQGDPTNTDRQRRFKQKSKVTDDNGDNALPPLITVNNDNDNDNDTIKKSAFVAPWVEQVRDYMASRNWAYPELEAEKFVAYYEERDWKWGKTNTPMKDWKRAVIQWESPERLNKPTQEKPKIPAHILANALTEEKPK